MIKQWNEIERLVIKILIEEFKVPCGKAVYDSELYTEAYIGYDKACKSFDSSKGTFNTYCMMVIRGSLKDYLKYNSGVIHVPVAKKDSVVVDTFSIYQTNDVGVELVDMFESTIDFSDDSTLRNYFIGLIDTFLLKEKGRARKALIAIRNNIENDEKLDTSIHRQYYYMAKKMLKDKYIIDVKNGII